MRELRDIIFDIQGEVGVKRDKSFGPITAENVLAALRACRMDHAIEKAPATSSADITFDERTELILATLDVKAVPMFREFLCLAKATAATLGCDYKLISGNRTWAEQDAIYAQGRTKPGQIVTNAKGGQSDHNFGIAADAGVFAGKLYLDESDPAKAAKVHKACSEHAIACGLEWGGSWKSFKDLPHYMVATGKTTAQLRAIFEKKGSVL